MEMQTPELRELPGPARLSVSLQAPTVRPPALWCRDRSSSPRNRRAAKCHVQVAPGSRRRHGTEPPSVWVQGRFTSLCSVAGFWKPRTGGRVPAWPLDGVRLCPSSSSSALARRSRPPQRGRGRRRAPCPYGTRIRLNPARRGPGAGGASPCPPPGLPKPLCPGRTLQRTPDTTSCSARHAACGACPGDTQAKDVTSAGGHPALRPVRAQRRVLGLALPVPATHPASNTKRPPTSRAPAEGKCNSGRGWGLRPVSVSLSGSWTL